MPPLALPIVALTVGAAVLLQTAINARMGDQLGHPLYGAWVNILVGSVILLALVLAFRVVVPPINAAIEGHGWLRLVGFNGAAFVFGALLIASALRRSAW